MRQSVLERLSLLRVFVAIGREVVLTCPSFPLANKAGRRAATKEFHLASKSSTESIVGRKWRICLRRAAISSDDGRVPPGSQQKRMTSYLKSIPGDKCEI